MQTDKAGTGESWKDHERMAHSTDRAGERPVSGVVEEVQAWRAEQVGGAVLRERGAAVQLSAVG